MTPIPWSVVAITGIVAATLAVIGVFGTKALSHVAAAAFASGSNPKAPESFSSFFLQSARIATVGVILLATVVLALRGELHEGAIGILSGIAGYVLGGVHPTRNGAENPKV